MFGEPIWVVVTAVQNPNTAQMLPTMGWGQPAHFVQPHFQEQQQFNNGLENDGEMDV
jgi:hypothetical protein